MRIGFVGLGHMGEPMARLLIDAGNEVAVYNRSHRKAEPLKAAGASVADSPAAACAGADAAVSMLADDDAVRSLTFGDSGIAAGLPPGAVHISSSTISVALARELAAEHSRRGQQYLSAAILARPEAVRERRAWILAAGPRDAMSRCRRALDALGQGVFELGDEPWRANLVKISLNFVLASMIETFGEVFALIEKSGLEREQFLAVLAKAILRGPAFEAYASKVCAREFDPAGFYLKLGLKDTKLALSAGEDSAVPLPLASLLRDHYLQAIAHGAAERDWSAVSDSPRRNAGLD